MRLPAIGAGAANRPHVVGWVVESRVFAALVTCFLVAAATPLAGVVPVQAATTALSFSAQADARVEKKYPSKNFGRATSLIIDASPVIESYVRFAPSGVDGTVTRAVLRVYASNGSVDGPALYPTSSAWTETGITWKNRPARTGGILADAAAIDTNTWVEYDVTPVVTENGTYSFNLTTGSGDGTTLHARESTSTALRPQLALTIDDGGEPDSTPPETTITSGPSGTVDERSATFGFTSSEGGSTFDCRLDEAAFAPCTSPQTYSGLADGSHTFEVRATDAAGNVDPSPATQTWTVDAISPSVETDPVPHAGDAADDPAIWVNHHDRSLSAIIGTDKQGGLVVYDLTGDQIQYLPVGDVNNVDVETGFPLGENTVPLVTAGNRSDNSIGIYEMVEETRQLRDVAARVINPGISVYGSCMYRSPRDGTFYVFVDSKRGEVEQWELFDNDAGKVDAIKVRAFDVGTQTEGCVADDELGHFYVGEESYGIWKYGAEPDDGTTRTLVAATSSTGPLVPDVEGLVIAYGANGTGYLIASSQGNSCYAVYTREGSNDYVKSFKVVSGNGIDGAEETDGIDVSTADLGSDFPDGLFVVQDGFNDNGNQNFKLVPYQELFAR